MILDTSILSLVLRRRPAARNPLLVVWFRDLAAHHRLYVPGIVLQELLSGVPDLDLAGRLDRDLSLYRSLLADEQDHRLAASLCTRCRVLGVTASATDALIAALALRKGAPVISTDPDFEHMAGVVPELRLVQPPKV